MTLTPQNSREGSASAVRSQLVLDAQTVISETVPREVATVPGLATNQRAYYMLAGLLEGDVVTGLAACVTTAGVTVTLAKLGIYSTAGVLLAQTADADTTFEATGIKSVPLTAPLTIDADAAYYFACLFVASVTLPTLLSGISTSVGAGLVNAAGSLLFATESSLADLPASATPVVSNANRSYWIAAY